MMSETSNVFGREGRAIDRSAPNVLHRLDAAVASVESAPAQLPMVEVTLPGITSDVFLHLLRCEGHSLAHVHPSVSSDAWARVHGSDAYGGTDAEIADEQIVAVLLAADRFLFRALRASTPPPPCFSVAAFVWQ
jgi:hypothetical protein|eukprot:COSAG01_NODE_1993_length_8694_cov_3.220826_4_plen_134_part_00